MRYVVLAATAAAMLHSPALADARGGGHSAHRSSSYCTVCVRNSHGTIARSEKARAVYLGEKFRLDYDVVEQR